MSYPYRTPNVDFEDFEWGNTDAVMASIAWSLNASEIPCVLWGDCITDLYNVTDERKVHVRGFLAMQTPVSKVTLAPVSSLRHLGHASTA